MHKALGIWETTLHLMLMVGKNELFKISAKPFIFSLNVKLLFSIHL